MLLTLVSLILLEQRYILLIAGAVILLLAVTLVVYFRKRLKSVEKEPEDDWNLGMQSLFIANPPPAQTTTQPVEESAIQDVEASPREQVFTTELEPVAHEIEASEAPAAEHTQLLYSEPRQEQSVDATTQEAEPENLIEPVESEARGETTMLGTGATDEATTFDEEVWSQLGTQELRSQQPDISTAEEAEQSEPVEQPQERPSFFEPYEPRREAKVEQRAPREPFEPPRIERITHREPYEAPTIEPLTPREQSAFTDRRRAQTSSPQHEREPEKREDRIYASGPVISERTPAENDSMNEPAAPPAYETAGADRAATPPIESVRYRKAPGGSVLGLPAESSDKPLVLGEPVRAADDAGIEALSRYGSRQKEKTGHAGTIALLVIVLLIGGLIGAYFVVPAFHNWVNATYANMRGKPAEDKSAKARIAGYSPTATNKIARAGGTVENISSETLEGLYVEVTLQRADDTAIETRRLDVVPPVLPPGERGRFEFEYPVDAGVFQYVVTKLMGSNGQIIFATNQR